MYIALEGIDTAGKSTQIDLLKKSFPKALFIKEPGYTPVGAQIREMVLNQKLSKKAELLLFLADRAETIENCVKPQLTSHFIISDRSLISNFAYGLENFDFSTLEQFNAFATGKTYPNVVIILKLTRRVLEERLSLKKADSIEERGIDYLLRVQDNLIETAKRLNLNTTIIDASLDRDSIHQHIKGVLI